tara:strand:+ start:1153 stop:2304 length:1152 start_codon:yes stop_codon:yes gene_type:complete
MWYNDKKENIKMKNLLTITESMKDNTHGEVVTFDFDQTIVKSFTNKDESGSESFQFGGVNEEMLKKIRNFRKKGTSVFVVSSRKVSLEDGETSVKALLKKFKVEVDGVFFTNGKLKAQKLYELGSTLHFDDDPAEHDAIIAFKQLHKDSTVDVKYPDAFLRDIEAVAKGIIVTSDGKYIIGQRSDSNEWDAPGGHLLQGEEPSYAFLREVKEELNLELETVDLLDKTETTWKGITKDTFYFVGKINKTSDELEGIVKLQWEVSDYFCDDMDGILSKTSGNMTQHLEDVTKLLSSEQETALYENNEAEIGPTSTPRRFRLKISQQIDEKKKKKKKKKKKTKSKAKKKTKKKGSNWGSWYGWGISPSSSDATGSDGAGGDGGGGE